MVGYFLVARAMPEVRGLMGSEEEQGFVIRDRRGRGEPPTLCKRAAGIAFLIHSSDGRGAFLTCFT